MVRRGAKIDPARQLAVAAARVAHENQAENIVVLDLRGLSPVTDYFVICTGTSDRQMRTVAEEIERAGRELSQRVWKVAGMETGNWILLDFVDVVVHVFGQSHRRFYDLELIWGEAPQVRWKRRAAPRARDAHNT